MRKKNEIGDSVVLFELCLSVVRSAVFFCLRSVCSFSKPNKSWSPIGWYRINRKRNTSASRANECLRPKAVCTPTWSYIPAINDFRATFATKPSRSWPIFSAICLRILVSLSTQYLSSYCLKVFILFAGERPFACSICDKRFTQKSNVDKHQLTHASKSGLSHHLKWDQINPRSAFPFRNETVQMHHMRQIVHAEGEPDKTRDDPQRIASIRLRNLFQGLYPACQPKQTHANAHKTERFRVRSWPLVTAIFSYEFLSICWTCLQGISLRKM